MAVTRKSKDVVGEFNTCTKYFADYNAIKKLPRASLCYFFFKHININTIDYKYMIKPGLLEYTFWNENLGFF